MVIEKSIEAAAYYVGLMAAYGAPNAGKVKWVPKNKLKIWLSDLMTLGLVELSRRRHPVSDANEYWTLTQEGKETLALLRRRMLELGEKPPERVAEEGLAEADTT
jgi:hypothetical protein